ncbi:MAG TPA: TasA family protein [Candidatus Limnocylindrales bacterium]|nr:TasA family protein [Candidatus Limnocylindrales bacterium]
MRKLNLLAGMALAGVVLMGLTATADKTSANFTATSTNPGNTFGSATVSMSNDKPNANDLVNVTNLVPGDTMSRTVTITNTGNAAFTYAGSISATANTTLWSDVTNGLQATVKRGTTVLYTGALKNLAIPASGTIAAGATDTLSFTFSFPTSATNAMQGLSQDMTITYTATQLAGSAK